MSANQVVQVVASACAPGKEAAFEKWYTEVHVPMLMEYEGVRQAGRYRLMGDADGAPKFLAFYEFESYEALEGFGKSDVLAAALKDLEERKEEIGFTMVWAAPYELIKSWER